MCICNFYLILCRHWKQKGARVPKRNNCPLAERLQKLEKTTEPKQHAEGNCLVENHR